MKLKKTDEYMSDLIRKFYGADIVVNIYDSLNAKEEFAKNNNATCMISGAGPTILLISNKTLNIQYDGWEIKELKVNNFGAYIYEE